MMIETEYRSVNDFYDAFHAKVIKGKKCERSLAQVMSWDIVTPGKPLIGGVEHGSFWLFQPRFFRRGLSQRIFHGRCIDQEGKILIEGDFHFPVYSLAFNAVLSILFTAFFTTVDLQLWRFYPVFICLIGWVVITGLEWITSIKNERRVIWFLSGKDTEK